MTDTTDNMDELSVTIGITNFNGEETLCQTIQSIKELDYTNYRLIIVDDASTDKSCEVARKSFPDIEIVKHEKNSGLSAVRNTIIKNSQSNLIFIVDNDITLDPQCLKNLVSQKKTRELAVVISPRVLFSDGKNVQSDGTKIHFIGAAIHYNRNTPIEDVKDNDIMEVECASGGMMLLDKKLAEKLNFFDEDFRFGWSDGEFMIRATLSGLKCYNLPSAKVYHHFKVWGTNRSFYQMRNRLFIIVINYSLRTLIVISPMLLLYEINLAVFMVLKRNLGDYTRSWIDVFKSLPALLRKRKIAQSQKILSDRDFLFAGTMTMDKGLAKNKLILFAKNLINNVFNIYWKTVVKLKLV